jgi:hypothetical protein
MKFRELYLHLSNSIKIIISFIAFAILIAFASYFLASSADNITQQKTASLKITKENDASNNEIKLMPPTQTINKSQKHSIDKKALEPTSSDISQDNEKKSLNRKCEKNALFVSNDETPVYSSPSDSAPVILNQKGKQRFLDPRSNLKIIETQKNWVKIVTLSPNWPPEELIQNAWIKKDQLANSNIDDDTNNCLYFDFSKWEDQAKGIIQQAKDSAYKILNNDKRCHRIVQAGYIGAGQRFYLTCYPSDGGRPYHYWFSLLNLNRNILIESKVNEDKASSLCNYELAKTIRNLAILAATENSEQPYTEIDDPVIRIKAQSYELVEHSWRLTIYFTSNESAEKKAYCYVDPSGHAEISIY